MSIIEYLERRKQDCEERLRYVESAQGFKMLQVTRDQGQLDVTAQETQRLRQARNDYQRAIDCLKGKSAAD